MKKYIAVIFVLLMLCGQVLVNAECVFSFNFNNGLPEGTALKGADASSVSGGGVILKKTTVSTQNPRLSLNFKEAIKYVPERLRISVTMSSTADSFIYYVQNTPNTGSIVRLMKKSNGSMVLQYGNNNGTANLSITFEQALASGTDFTVVYDINMKNHTFCASYNNMELVNDVPFFVNVGVDYTEELEVAIFEHTGTSGSLIVKDITVSGDFPDISAENMSYIEDLDFDVSDSGMTVSGNVQNAADDTMVVSGIYQGGSLVDVKTASEKDFSITHSGIDLSGCSVKVAVLQGADKLIPVCNSYPASEKEIKTYSTIEDRKRLLINGYSTKPFPDPYGDSNADIGKIGYALSLFYLNKDNELANEMLRSCLENCDATLGENSGIYFQMSILATIAIKYGDRLIEENKNACEKFFYEYLNSFSEVAKTKGVYSHDNSEFYMEGSGNHHVIRRQAFLLGAQLLKESEAYKDCVLNDGYTVKEHYEAWEKYWLDDIVYRIKYAPEVEFFSVGYGKYTLDCFFGIYDLSENEKLREMAKNYLDYLMAELVVQSTNGIYGGARGRSVRTEELSSITDFYLNMIYFNQNTEWKLKGGFDVITGVVNSVKDTTTCHPNIMSMFVSDYKPPFVLVNLALSDTETLEYESYPLGAGGRSNPFEGYYVFSQPSYYKRYTYMTPTYTVGSMTIDRSREYTEIQQQNRYVGIHFKNSYSNNSYLRVFPDTERSYARGFNDLQSVASGSAMLVMSLPEAKYYNSELHRDIKIAVSKQFYDNHSFENGWMFAKTKDGKGYIAIKPSKGEIEGWSEEMTSKLCYLLMTERNVPIVMQAGSYEEFGSFEAFCEAVINTKFVWNSDTEFAYMPISGGEEIVFYTTKVLPTVGGKTVELSSDYIVKSPYFTSIKGSGRATIENLYSSKVVLDFNHNDF